MYYSYSQITHDFHKIKRGIHKGSRELGRVRTKTCLESLILFASTFYLRGLITLITHFIDIIIQYSLVNLLYRFSQYLVK